MILADSTRMDTERAMRSEIEGNWPTSVTLAGERFEVAYGVSSQDEIVGFSLIDSKENELLQCDIAVVYLVAEHIPEIIVYEYSMGVDRFKGERERELYRAIEAEYYWPVSELPEGDHPAIVVHYPELFPLDGPEVTLEDRQRLIRELMEP
jgi:hypothetical protein